MNKDGTVGLLFLGLEDPAQQIVQGGELLRVLFNGRIVSPTEDLIVLDGALGKNLAVSMVSAAKLDHTSGDTWGRCRPFRGQLLDSDAVQAVLVSLLPIWAAFFHSHRANDGTKHDDQRNVLVPDHLPKVCERWVRSR